MYRVRLFKVGCDPEFALLNEDELVNASEVINETNAFGLDGCDFIAELRPSPSINPSQVVQTLHKDMVRGYYNNPEVRELYWKAGSSSQSASEGAFATGGHIHLGIDRSLPHNVYGNKMDFYLQIVSHLDTYLSQLIRLLELPKETGERAENEYGYPGDVRTNNHGIEYRTLGSWLTSPRVAEGVLCLAQTVVYQAMWAKANRKESQLGNLDPREGCECDIWEEGCSCYFSEDVSRINTQFRKKFPELRTRIRRMKLYPQHEVPIEFIFRLVEKEKTWFPGKGVDMKMAWGISGVSKEDVKRPAAKILPPVKFDDIWKRAQ